MTESMRIPETVNDLYERIYALAQVTFPSPAGSVGGLYHWYAICKAAGVEVPPMDQPAWGERVLGLTYYELLAVYGYCWLAWDDMISQVYKDPSNYIHARQSRELQEVPAIPAYQDHVEPL